MKLSKLAGALMAAGLALAASFSATASYAQNPEPDDGPPVKKGAKAATAALPAVNPMELAPQIVATAKINCEPINAKVIGQTEIDGADGKKTRANMFEIACKAGPGFILTAPSATDVKQPFSCNYLVKIKEKQADATQCTLPENLPEYKWLTPVVQKFVPGCEVIKARVIGSTTTAPLIDRYEFACAAGSGGVLDYAQLGQTAETEYKNCLIFDGTASACTFTTKAQLIEALKPLAASANPNCQVTDARFVGITKDNDGFYYEFGCATPPGFIALANLDGSYNRSVACASAMGLGGCKFTDANVAAADANAYMTGVLKANGKTCTVKDYTIHGTQESTKRDYAEFACPEQPFGLIGFVPQPGSDGQTRVYDCFMDQTGRKMCTMVKPDDLMKHLDRLIKVAQPTKNCDVKEVRYIGESSDQEDALLAELACVNKRGYIVLVSPDRKTIVDAVPCTIARSQKMELKCEIAGNGTYSSAANDD
ncbi:hypothetical protein ABI_32010 [Asticcacaulis biprosthecium C19]|uniref:Uncharacterized protein n=1 Tax=Asticcacaulis biprosthecium C19 TaxID=715226 RepID=F4QPP9_9CAUL|nr:hypothetical protein [Asticcacaulis biprosthecium]EGF90186.1 hypothetical protein ABI_32010 [Asticcacaulis biprosthecium C19]